MTTRDFSKVACRVWRSKKFTKLKDESAKLFYLYLLTCPHSSSAGLFVLPLGYVAHDMGWSAENVDKAIQACVDVGLIQFDDDEQAVYIVGWYEVNPPTNTNHAKKVVSEALAVPDCEIRKQCLLDLQDCLKQKQWESPPELETLCEGYRKGIDRVEKGFRHSDSDSTQTKTKTQTQDAREPKPVDSEEKSLKNESSRVELKSEGATKSTSYNIAEHIQWETLQEAKDRVPGWDIEYVLNVYNGLVNKGDYPVPNHPAAAFLNFCDAFYRKRGRPK